jgi:hypothetical protein
MLKSRRSKLALGIIFLLAFILFTCKTDPQAVQTSELEEFPEPYYKVTFLAYDRGTEIEGKKSIAGHASVAVDDADIWGFYPEQRGWFITKRGMLIRASDQPEIHESVAVFVDVHVMGEIRALINEWETAPPIFAIPFMDCVTFVYRVCDIIGLKYDHMAIWPTRAVRSIGRLNNRGRIYKSAPRE